MKKDTSVIGCIFLSESVLLVKRRDVPVWVLPGGGIEKNESPEEAIVREIKEETGYSVKIIKKVGEYTPLNRLTRFTHLFECSIISGKSEVNDECQEIKFFPLKNLPIMPLPYEDWIKDALANLPLIKKSLNQVTYFQLFKNLLFHPILVIRFLLSRLGLRIND